MKSPFGFMPDGRPVSLYTFSAGQITARVTDLGAGLVQIFVPDKNGNLEDVILGYDRAEDYLKDSANCFGVTVGRSANRIANAEVTIGDTTYHLAKNDNDNNLHSGPDAWFHRLWEVKELDDTHIIFYLRSEDGDQGYPGSADITVTFSFEAPGKITITYDAISDKDTLFNLTNHSYFNLCGNQNTNKAMTQTLMMPARVFNPDNERSIPTGEVRSVENSPMDFRVEKELGRDILNDYDALNLQNGYDHNFEVYQNPCAILKDPISGRILEISTDCPGVQLYTGNYIDAIGKNGCVYGSRSGVALETQFCPDSVHHPEWPQPFVKAGVPYHSVTIFEFK